MKCSFVRMVGGSTFLVSLLACGGGALPPVNAVPEVPPRPDGSTEALDREVQEQANVVHRMCTERREELASDVESAEAGDLGLISAATVAMVLGEAADGDGIEQFQEPTTDRVEPLPQAQPSKRLATETRNAAEARIAEINRAMDDAQAFLSAKPDPTAWTDEHESTWNQRLDTLRKLCR